MSRVSVRVASERYRRSHGQRLELSLTFQRRKRCQKLPIHLQQNITSLQLPISRPLRHNLIHHKHPFPLRKSLSHFAFNLLFQSQPPNFIIRSVFENGLDIATGNFFAGFDEFERANDAVQGEEEGRGSGAGSASGVQGDAVAGNVQDGRAGRAARGHRRRLIVDCGIARRGRRVRKTC